LLSDQPSALVDGRQREAQMTMTRDSSLDAATSPHELVQEQLTRLWTKLLSVEPTLDDEFVALGGTPALIDRMLDAIERACGQRLQAADLGTPITVRRLADVIVVRLLADAGTPWATPATSPRRAQNESPQDILQDQLVALWESILGCPTVGIDDEFALRGGTPESMAAMFASVERLCGESVGAHDFTGALTVRNLAYLLVSRVSRAPIIEIQPGTAGVVPLFFLHGDFGGGGYYVRTVARVLGADRGVYALKQHGFHGEDLPASIEAMAADHVRMLNDVRPHGSVHLGGHCTSALIALEMAHQLEAQGRPVASLVLIEPPVYAPGQGVGVTPPLRLSPELRRLPRIRPTWLFGRYRAMLPAYQCPAFGGRIAVFWARDAREVFDRTEASLVLRELGPRVELSACRGNHISMLGRHIDELAAAIKAHLDHVGD
jgi:thioesterase superfamily protein